MSILVPIDFSDCTHGLVDRATELAGRLGTGVTLLHVIEPPTELGQAHLDGPDGPTAVELLSAESAQLLDHHATRARKSGTPIRTDTRTGRPGEAILKAAHEPGVEMVMMGTHGRKGVRRMVLGSIAEHVVRRAEVPVITMRTQHRPECAAKNCAVCTDDITSTQRRLSAELDG